MMLAPQAPPDSLPIVGPSTILTIPLGAIVIALGLFLRGKPITEPFGRSFSDPRFLAIYHRETYFFAAWLLLILGHILLLVGYLALHQQMLRNQQHPNFTAILTVLGMTMWVAMFGVITCVYPALLANLEQSSDAVLRDLDRFAAPYNTIGALLLLIAMVKWATLLWRSGWNHKWSGALLPFAHVLLLSPSYRLAQPQLKLRVFDIGANAVYAMEFVGAGVLIVAGLTIWRAANRFQKPESRLSILHTRSSEYVRSTGDDVQ
jgi:uncharacterized membrane protein YidH (DUF202 family)